MKRVLINKDASGKESSLVYTWRSYIAFFLIFFCAFWNSFLVFWYSIAFTDDVPIVFVLFPLIHVGVGICLSYFTLCSLFNKTTISKSGGVLIIKHGPLPLFSTKQVDLGKVNYIHVQEKYYKNSKGRGNVQYIIHANIGEGDDEKLISPYLLQSNAIANEIKRFICGQLGKKQFDHNRGKMITSNVFSVKDMALFKKHSVVFSEIKWEQQDKNDEVAFIESAHDDKLSGAYFYANHQNSVVWQEIKLTKSQALTLVFKDKKGESGSFPVGCTLEGVDYHLIQNSDGILFVEGQFIDHIKQWIYIAQNRKHIRIVQYRNKEGLDLYNGDEVDIEHLV